VEIDARIAHPRKFPAMLAFPLDQRKMRFMKTCIATALLLASSIALAAGKTNALPPGHPPISKTPVDLANIRVDKATGPNAKTVEEVVTQRATLKDQPVVVRGKVVKFNAGIMGKNWVHLRDGTGTQAKNNNDILVTTQDTAKPGDVVTARGTVRIDKDFGSGYAYDVLIEDASLAVDKAKK
jgi:hypothetical protein